MTFGAGRLRIGFMNGHVKDEVLLYVERFPTTYFLRIIKNLKSIGVSDGMGGQGR